MPNDYTSLPQAAQPVRYLELLARAIAHVDAHLAADLNADLLAERAAMSRHHFHRIFRAYVGTTVTGYVTWRRLYRACELLAGSELPVLEVALEVGYESAQALAKAMRRELDTTPSAVRAGSAPCWQRLFDRRPQAVLSPSGDLPMLQPEMIDLPAFSALTATGRGMKGGNMGEAAQRAFGELIPAINAAGQQMASCLSLLPDEPQGPDDPNCRMYAGAVFGYSLTERQGYVARPDIPLQGSLAWLDIAGGRYARFTYIGPYERLHTAWEAVYSGWLPATGYALRDSPPFEVYVNASCNTPPQALRTDLYLPLV